MLSFEYIAPFLYQKEAQEPGFLIRKDRSGNLCIQRGECAVIDQIYCKVYRSPYLLNELEETYDFYHILVVIYARMRAIALINVSVNMRTI